MSAKSAKTQQANDGGNEVREYRTSELYAKAPGWKIPFRNLAYSYEGLHSHCINRSELTFGLATMAKKGEYLVPTRQSKVFLVGTDLAELLEASGLLEVDLEYVDVWQTVDVNDQPSEGAKFRRAVAGTIARIRMTEDGSFRPAAPRRITGSINVLLKDAERFGIEVPIGVGNEEAAKAPAPVSGGCEYARQMRRRRELEREFDKGQYTVNRHRAHGHGGMVVAV